MKLFKKVGIVAIAMFSFYYTDKIATLVLESNSLYQEINEKKDDYEIKSIAAIIEDDYIIPGLTGLEVDVKNSYYNMKSLEVFNSYYLKYSSSTPEISLEQNIDKIIKKGNSAKRSVALICEFDENILNYLKEYNFSVLVNMDTFKKNVFYEQINNEVSNFKKLEDLINKYTTNVNICILNSGNEKICRDNNKYLVEPNKTLSDSTVLELKDNIDAGDIILIKKGTKIDNIEIIIKSIKYKDYEINSLSKHISEERD